MSADIIIYALVAAGLVFWLKNVLGTKHGDERERPNPFTSAPEDSKPSETSGQFFSPETELGIMDDDKAVSSNADVLPYNVKIDNKTAENGLDDIGKMDSDFNLSHFVNGAQSAFVMIVEAFAKGDLETLENLLGQSVYRSFENAIHERQKNKETVITEIHAVHKMNILEAFLKNDMAYITVEFTAEETCIIKDDDGNIKAGDPDKTTEMVDIWMFGRNINSKDPKWMLYETRDGEEEDHKTPIPDAS